MKYLILVLIIGCGSSAEYVDERTKVPEEGTDKVIVDTIICQKGDQGEKGYKGDEGNVGATGSSGGIGSNGVDGVRGVDAVSCYLEHELVNTKYKHGKYTYYYDIKMICEDTEAYVGRSIKYTDPI